jgi:F420-dependent oxidoreductase-like protein
MRIGMPIPYSGGFRETVGELMEFERAGLDVAFVAEAYSFDAVSQLGFIAARTRTLKIAAGILNIYSRSPALLGMTAAGLDYVSDGRFILGLGASGPQVIEGFHGQRFAAPLTRTREIVDVINQVLARQPVVHDGPQVHIPLTSEHGGSGLGKPLKIINRPVRSHIPLVLAALGPKNVALAAEMFDGWEPIFFLPEGAAAAFGAALAEGNARRDPALGPLEIYVDAMVDITTDPARQQAALARVRNHLALYIGGMGAKGANFYNDIACRYGFEKAAAEVQDLYLTGRKAEAAAALPDEFVRGVSLIGDESRVVDRLQALAAVGVTTVNASLLAPTYAERLATVTRLKELAA